MLRLWDARRGPDRGTPLGPDRTRRDRAEWSAAAGPPHPAVPADDRSRARADYRAARRRRTGRAAAVPRRGPVLARWSENRRREAVVAAAVAGIRSQPERNRVWRDGRPGIPP